MQLILMLLMLQMLMQTLKFDREPVGLKSETAVGVTKCMLAYVFLWKLGRSPVFGRGSLP